MSLDVDVYPLFSTPLYKTNLERNNDDVLTFTENEKFIFLEKEKNGHKSNSSYVLEALELKQLKSEIQNNVNFFVYDVLGVNKTIEFNITNSWIMKHETGHWAQEHFHDNCLITGIYYFDVRDDSGNISFKKNKMLYNLFPPLFDIPFHQATSFNGQSFTFTPKNGELFLFPSHVPHEVSVNLNQEERHCLVFNVFIKGTLGSDDGFNRLDFK